MTVGKPSQPSSDAIVERLAAIEHERWSHWQRYLHEVAARQPDGGLLLPKDLVQRWERQMATDYSDLSYEEQESDRDQARKYLAILRKILNENQS